MSIGYKEWCENNKNITPLIRALKSSLPEQYIGFYLSKVFGEEIEYQTQFDWLDRSSLDIYIPSLKLAIEYDGVYYHSGKRANDDFKTAICRSHDIYLIHICERTHEQEKSRKRNEINYYFLKNYKNIKIPIQELVLKINKKYGTAIQVDVNLERDENDFIGYVQNKYYKKSIAYVWPESKEYWLEDKNKLTVFDIFYTDDRWFSFKCPHCNKEFRLYMRYYHDRKSLMPCDCEYEEIEKTFKDAIKNYKDTGELVVLDDSLQSRRLYDYMASIVKRMWRCTSREEAEMYKKLGFKSPYIDLYLSLF